MSTHKETFLAARFAALAPEPFAGDWDDVLKRASRAREPGRRLAHPLQGLRGRRRLVVIAAVVLAVVIGTSSALAVRAYVLHQGIVGLPAKGATPSTPTRGELVVRFMFGHSYGDPGRFSADIYADGRMIWHRIADYRMDPDSRVDRVPRAAAHAGRCRARAIRGDRHRAGRP